MSESSDGGCTAGPEGTWICSNGWWRYDTQGIELCKACHECEEFKLKRFRPEVLTGYTQEDVTVWSDGRERIEPEV